MRIAIFGVGAMGTLFGAHLTPHANVTLIGRWSAQLEALSNVPLWVLQTDGQKESVAVKIVNYERAPHAVDVALILTKASGTDNAARTAANILKPDGIAVTLQNGIGNIEIIEKHVGKARAVLGITTQGAATDGPGVVRVGGTGITTLAANPTCLDQVQALSELFNRAGFPTAVVEDVSSLVWGKLAINAAINPLTALLSVKNGELLNSEHTRSLMREAALEVADVAAALGIGLPFDAAAKAAEVAQMTAPNRSSMLQDISRGVETEIETINGAVMRKGEEVGVPTPVNRTLYHLVKARGDG